MLVGGQLVVKKQVYGVTNISRQLGATSKQVSIHHGRFTLDPSRLPVLGSSAASNFIVSVFDYTCGHCRALHELLRAAEKKHSGRLGIITLPMPLDAACNPLIFVTASGNQDACKYARLSLAVWHSKPEMFGQFDDWLFDSTSPPAVDLVYAKAVAMVGKESLDRSLESVWVTRQLQTNIEIYEANSRLIRDGRLPQLVLGNVITHGAIESLEQLLALIERHTPVGQSGSSDVRPETRQSRP